MSGVDDEFGGSDWERGVSRGSLLGAAVGTLGLWLLFGVWGGLGGVLVSLCLFVVPSVFAFAIGQLVLAALLPESGAPGTLIAGELALLPLLSDVLTRGELTATERVQSGAVGGVVLLGSGVVATAVSPRWLGALAIAVGISVIIYGLHRYAVVTFEREIHES
jgi:hypothetical protein